jgi:peptidoglycan/LPS O-acetylase OafA/YrhL
MGFYAVTPLLRIYVKLTTQAAINYFVIVSFFLGFIYCYFAIFILNKTLVNSLNALNFFLPYLGYFIAGYRLKNFSENKRQRKYCLLFFVGTVLLGTLCTFFLAKKFGTTSPKGLYLYASLSPMVIVMSLAAFIILRRLSKKLLIMVPERMHSFIMHAARLSFGVYLIHPLIMDWLNRYIQQTGGYPNIWIAMPLFIVVVIILSFLLCSVILKIPIVKNIID